MGGNRLRLSEHVYEKVGDDLFFFVKPEPRSEVGFDRFHFGYGKPVVGKVDGFVR